MENLTTIDATANEGTKTTTALTTTTTETSPATTTNRTAMATALLSHATRQNGGIPPELRMTYKEDKWFIGGVEVDSSDDYYADAFDITTAWTFRQNGQIVDRIPASVGQKLPPRASLGFTDESTWEPGLDGRPQDPCQEEHIIKLTRRRDGKEFYFTTTSRGGKDTIANLSFAAASRPEEIAIVTLKTSGYHAKRFGGRWVPTPVLDARQWVRASTLKMVSSTEPPQTAEHEPIEEKANAALNPGADFDDEIPF